MQFLSTYVVNGSVAFDAGCLGFFGSPAEQARVKHVFLTHTHLDHVASLPMFLDNVYQGGGDCVTVYGSECVLECLCRDLFNDRLWPDYLRISRERPPYLRLQPLQPRQAVAVDGLRITPIEVHHSVPTCGYLVADDKAAVLITSDTGPTAEVWSAANETPDLRAIFLEASLNNDLAWLAELACHLTPHLLSLEMKKVKASVRWVVVHIHPRCREQVLRELRELDAPNLEIARFGSVYEF
jgi:ribonuclease BN (tRNA processing enzyme)